MAAAGPLIITSLPDGVSVSGAESLRQVVATWDVFVTLEPPPYPRQLLDKLDALDHTFVALTDLKMGALDLSLEAHRIRRDHIRESLTMAPSSSRVKRGLLDVGGSLLHALFGVATSSQLDRFKAALTEIAGTQTDISHANLQLATVVNQTSTYLRAVAVKQHQLEINVLHINSAIAQLSHALENQATRLHRLELLTALDRYMDILDLATRQYADQMSLYNRQRAGLELGHLTRDLLTMGQLRDIINQAASAHQVVDNLEWYYSYVSVSPLWRKSDSLLYKIELPLIAPRPFLMYQVAALPVPIDNSSYAVQLNLESHYAIDTVTGNMFVPHQCLGHSPIVCQSGPTYGPSMLKCARGLITSRADLLKHCKATIKDHSDHSPISTLALNQYAIATQGETLTVRCPGRPESHTTLTRGTYNVTCLHPCSIEGKGYFFTCVDRLFLSKRFVFPEVKISTHFNFSTAVEVEKLHLSLPQLQHASTHPILDLNAHALIHPVTPVSTPPIRSRPSLLAIINLVTLFTIVMALTIIYWRHRFCKRKHAPVISDTLSGEALPLTTKPHNEELQNFLSRPINLTTPTTQPQSIWPTLTNVSECVKSPPQCTP